MAENKNESMTLVNFRVDSVVKDSAEAVLAGMGLSVSAYVGMCLRKLAQDKGIPFDLRVDSGFWDTEVSVSRVMESVESGLFQDSVVMFAAAIRKYNELGYEVAIANRKVAAYLPYLDTFVHRGSLQDFYHSLALMVHKASNIAANPAGMAMVTFAEEIATEVISFIESEAAGIAEKHNLGSDMVSKKVGARDTEAAVMRVSDVLESAANIYDNHGNQIAMRFVSSKMDGEMLDEIKSYSAMRKRAKKQQADQTPERRNEELELAIMYDRASGEEE